MLVESEIIRCLRILSSSGVSSAFLQRRFNTCKGSKRALKRPHLCTGVEFKLQLKSLSRDHREKTGDTVVDFKESLPTSEY